jgi:acetyl-CoA carboxylase biotin carboxylase subunit
MLFRKVLVANRGEIAVRVMATAKRLGLATVAVYSEADAAALHVAEADEAVCIGPADARHSYLNAAAILAAVQQTGADALHPGYGFLSENAPFAAQVQARGCTFVGPPAKVIATMGVKTVARAAAVQAGVPVLPGSAALQSLPEAEAAATALGYPVLLKPAAGGGGMGMQRVDNAQDLAKHFVACQTRAGHSFGDATVYLEKYLAQAHHIEVQVAADAHGNAVHLGERECSIQRRHQKVLEETPSPAVGPDLRRRITEAALRLVHHVGYQSLGTVEMLVENDSFYFLEMNTRLQVEHTVTEMVTGLDLVEWQFRIAMGEPLPAAQAEIVSAGHAVQCRICAENPQKRFMPSPGTLSRFAPPSGAGVRNDVGVRQGDKVTPYYDSLLAKLVVHGDDRPTALARLGHALAQYEVAGVCTNLALHQQIVADPAFIRGAATTQYLQA